MYALPDVFDTDSITHGALNSPSRPDGRNAACSAEQLVVDQGLERRRPRCSLACSDDVLHPAGASATMEAGL